MPLSLARSGDQVVCVSVEGSVGSRRHLSDLGILPGTRMQVVSGGLRTGTDNLPVGGMPSVGAGVDFTTPNTNVPSVWVL